MIILHHVIVVLFPILVAEMSPCYFMKLIYLYYVTVCTLDISESIQYS